MDRIIIQEVDNTSNVEALSSYDVVYVPGFSLNGASPVMTEGEESLFRNPRLVTSKYEFKRLYGDQCPTFETDQLYPVATTAANGFPSYAIPGFVPPGEPTEVANVATVAYTNVPSTDADRVALIQGEANYYTKTIFSETEDTQVAPEGWEPDPEVTYYEAIFDDTNHLATMKALKADATSGYEGKFVFESSVSPVELAWRILYNGRYIATDDEEIGFTLLGEANDAVNQFKEEPKSVENIPSNKIDTPVKSSDKEGSKAPKSNDVSTSQQISVNGSSEEIALDVIRGVYGNGEERKQKLGDSYREIQDIVNDMYRKGLVH